MTEHKFIRWREKKRQQESIVGTSQSLYMSLYMFIICRCNHTVWFCNQQNMSESNWKEPKLFSCVIPIVAYNVSLCKSAQIIMKLCRTIPRLSLLFSYFLFVCLFTWIMFKYVCLFMWKSVCVWTIYWCAYFMHSYCCSPSNLSASLSFSLIQILFLWDHSLIGFFSTLIINTLQ